MTVSFPADAADPENTMYMRVSTGGTITMELLPDLAPKHVERIKKLARESFYDGVVFHRVIDGFMAQTGDPTGTGTGGSDYPDLPAEFSDAEYKRGTVGMARTNDPNSANSQFFICVTDTGCSFLKGQYTVFAQVTDGMDVVDSIAKGEPPATPDKIEKFVVASDVKTAAEQAEAEKKLEAERIASEQAAERARKEAESAALQQASGSSESEGLYGNHDKQGTEEAAE